MKKFLSLIALIAAVVLILIASAFRWHEDEVKPLLLTKKPEFSPP